MTAEEIWRAKSDEDLLRACQQWSDYTAAGQAIILAELDRRQLERPAVDTNTTEAALGRGRAYKRVGGWVALFCLSPLVLGPIQAIRQLLFLIALVRYNKSLRALWTESAIDGAAGIALLVFAFVVAVQLLRIRPNAVKLTMAFLASLVGYAVFAAAAPLLFGRAVRMSQVRDVGWVAAYAAVWAAYFKKSKRVAATYGSVPMADGGSAAPT